MPEQTVVSNRRAFHDYKIEDRLEAGIVLRGSEVKSLRESKATMADAYAVIDDGEVWLHKLHIAAYSSKSTHETVDPERRRKLLLHASEIDRLNRKAVLRGYTLIPLRVYFKDGKAKVEIGVAMGKKHYDHRRDLAERESKRDADRAASNRRR